MEHNSQSIETIRMLIATTPKSEIVPIVRILATEYHFVSLSEIDVGAMIPMCETADQARLLVNSAIHRPDDRRGTTFNLAHDEDRSGSIPEIIQSANNETLLISRIVTARGLENVEEIASAPGIDAVWIGLYDLTLSLGIPGQMTHPEMLAATDRVFAGWQARNNAPAALVTSISEGEAKLQRGFTLITSSGDLWIYEVAFFWGDHNSPND